MLDKPKTPELYLLPKIHKSQVPPPGRPIISANSSPTERISAFVDTFLRPIVGKGASYIKDTTDFLNKMDKINTMTPDSLLVSLDVSSLYTNIPNREGVQATHQALLTDRGLVNNPSNLSLAALLWLVLTLNNFKFDGKNYLQIGGTAMGTRLAPSFANIYMNHFEDNFVYPYPHKPTVWYRYIDDIFMIWDHGRDELNKFITYLNTSSESIKFTSEISGTELNFLDVKVKMENSHLTTDLYVKPTDRNTYLPYNSAHPRHCMRGLPYGQSLRIRRICSRDEDFKLHAAKKAAQLSKHGYPKDLLDSMIRAYNKDRRSLLSGEEKNTNEIENENIFLTTTYNKQFTGLQDQVTTTWDLLGRSNTTRFLQSKKVKVGYRRPKNLRDLLTRARLPPLDTDGDDSRNLTESRALVIEKKGCENPKCRYCPRLNKSGKITSKSTGRTYTTRKNVDCTSNNLVYCISCKKCGKQYVGQTMNTVKKRFQGHFYLMKHKKEDHEVSRHFNQPDHKGLDDVEIHILWFINHDAKKDETKNIRLRYEFDWIHRLRTQIPLGLNTIDIDH